MKLSANRERKKKLSQSEANIFDCHINFKCKSEIEIAQLSLKERVCPQAAGIEGSQGVVTQDVCRLAAEMQLLELPNATMSHCITDFSKKPLVNFITFLQSRQISVTAEMPEHALGNAQKVQLWPLRQPILSCARKRKSQTQTFKI